MTNVFLKVMSTNKKIINAEQVSQNNIKFRSKSERMMYNTLVSLGFSPEFEAEKFVIWKGFTPSTPLYIDGVPQLTKTRKKDSSPKIPKFIDWHYTPDFKLTLGKSIFYIECKGFGNDIWSYKRKLFLKTIEGVPFVHFFEVHTKRGLLKTVEIINSIYERENTCREDDGNDKHSS